MFLCGILILCVGGPFVLAIVGSAVIWEALDRGWSVLLGHEPRIDRYSHGAGDSNRKCLF